MPTNVVMPQLGESVVEGTVSRWLKAPGDRVQAFEPLLEVSTDKVDTEIPAPASGVLVRIVVPAGQTVAHGTVLAEIGEAEAVLAAAPAVPAAQAAPVAPAAPAMPAMAAIAAPAAAYAGGGHITPVVARMAAEHGLDLNAITGTGREGRITKRDVEAYLQTRAGAAVDPWDQPGSGDLFKPTVDYSSAPAAAPAVTAPAVTAPAVTAPAVTAPAATAPAVAAPAVAAPAVTAPAVTAPAVAAPAVAANGVTDAPGQLVPLSSMRRAIADHMVRSKLHTSPHVTTVFEVDFTAVNAHRAAHKAPFQQQGATLTLTAYVVLAAAAALRAVPRMNAEWRSDGIFLHQAQHIGMAVALDDGLIVPVIRHAGDLNLMGAARAVGDLAQRARAKALKPAEVVGGTFTITNHGTSGSLVATPIINQPQAAILGVGAVEKRVKVISDSYGTDAIAIRPCAYVSLTFDHRIGDGADGDAFLAHLKATLEGWPAQG